MSSQMTDLLRCLRISFLGTILSALTGAIGLRLSLELILNYFFVGGTHAATNAP